MSENCFVYVVCGSKEHIDTLHFSLEYLKKKSRSKILVLTDSSRNEIPVEHDAVIDIQTPVEFDHHQASIFLKTGIFQFVPTGFNYCYLDTDVLPLSSDVDLIFNEFITPIRFAPDHCVMDKFSAYSVNCGCQEKWLVDRNKFNAVIKKYDLENQTEEIKTKRKELQAVFEGLKTNRIAKIKTALRFLASYPFFKLNKEFTFDKKKRVWLDREQNILMYDVNKRKLERETGLKYNRFNQKWYNSDKEDIWADECQHLKAYISSKFNTEITDSKWQHWNGGVFLFNDSSHEFLSSWFNSTLEIFKDAAWKTRDQGTLIATVWKFGLQNHPTLDKKWNLIADYNNMFLKWTSEQEVQLTSIETVNPNFVHVYHHFGDENWSFWNQLIQRLNT